jgi:effector-binding domain-containing protein
VDASSRPVTLARTVATPTAVVAEATTWEAFPALWPELLAEVWAFVRRAGLETGRNVMVYRDDVPNVEVGVEVRRPFAGGDRVVPSSLPAGLAARTVERGPPSAEGLATAHAAVLAWCDANRHPIVGTRWEVYDHWREERDPAEFETEVFWLLREGDRA